MFRFVFFLVMLSFVFADNMFILCFPIIVILMCFLCCSIVPIYLYVNSLFDRTCTISAIKQPEMILSFVEVYHGGEKRHLEFNQILPYTETDNVLTM